MRRFRTNINQELSKYTLGELELTKNMAVLLFPDETQEKFDFPNNKAISDIVLLINNILVQKITDNELELDQNEVAFITKEQLMRLLKDMKQEYQAKFSKYYKDMPLEDFFEEITSYMIDYDFLRKYENGYKVYPGVSKLTGYFPKEGTEQTTLFGGDMSE